jgi:hypothetical protein
MRKKRSNEKKSKLILPTMTTMSLKGKQSVRETFKLPSSCVRAINIVAKQLRIKQKSLFDHLAEDISGLESIAQKAGVEDAMDDGRTYVQKSYIISRNTLRTLTDISKRFGVSRDVLIERSVQRLLPIIEKEKESHRKRMRLLQGIENYMVEGHELSNQIEQSVGVEDPLCQAFKTIMTTFTQVKTQIDDIIDRGKRVERFQTETLH